MPKRRTRRPPARRPAARRHRPRPAVPRPTAPGLRGAVERRSAPVLVWLSSRPKVLLPLVSVLLLVGGLAAPLPFGLPLLLLLLALVGWLTYLSWPAVVGGGRVVRLATVAMVAAAVGLKLVGG